jgi:hypothetical protein
MSRNRSKPHTFDGQIAIEKARLEAQLIEVPHGPPRDALLRKIRQLEMTLHLNSWLTSPGLQSPKPWPKAK